MKFSDEELIEDLKKVQKLLDKVPTQTEYNANGTFSTTTYTNRKPWSKWLFEVFGKANRQISWRNGNRIAKKDLIENLLCLHKKIGRIPRKEDLKYGKYGVSGYNRVFGNFSNALVAVGLRPNNNCDFTNEELIIDLQRVYNKLGRTPSLEDFDQHSETTSCMTIYKRFGSWTKSLLAADIPIERARNVSKQDVIDALNIWYNKNSKDVSCLEYWNISKARSRREFPYSCATVSTKFDKVSWENIMKTIDPTYRTINQFVRRGHFVGKDGGIYLSSIEKQSADILYNLKSDGKIKDYEYEAKICNERSWTCDFKITLNDNNYLWLEIDGMRKHRRHPYNSGKNEKIEYYKKANINYGIVSYNNRNIGKTIGMLTER